MMIGLEQIPFEHIKDVYYYRLYEVSDGEPYLIAINDRRNQWYSTTDEIGGKCFELTKYLCAKYGKFGTENDYANEALRIIGNGKKAVEDIPLNAEFGNVIVIGRKPVVMPWKDALKRVYVPGISVPVMEEYGWVGVLPKDGTTEEDRMVTKAMNTVRRIMNLLK